MSIAHVAMAVRDVGKTAKFFEDTLGWKPIRQPGNIARTAAWLTVGEGQELHLIEVPGFEPSPFEREYGRHIAVRFPLDGFDALKRRLADCGAEVIDADRPTPFQRFFFRSPDGYSIEVVEQGAAAEG